jgi:hypothetical protein
VTPREGFPTRPAPSPDNPRPLCPRRALRGLAAAAGLSLWALWALPAGAQDTAAPDVAAADTLPQDTAAQDTAAQDTAVQDTSTPAAPTPEASAPTEAAPPAPATPAAAPAEAAPAAPAPSVAAPIVVAPAEVAPAAAAPSAAVPPNDHAAETTQTPQIAQSTQNAPGAQTAGTAGTAQLSSRWSIGITAGTYTPSLGQFNDALHKAGLVILQDPNFLIPRNQDLPVTQRDVSTPPLTDEISYGVEAQWQARPRVAVVFMLLNWQGRSTISDTITMALRSNLPPVDVPRTARYNLNLNQFWVGWRYSLYDNPGKSRLFINLGVAGYAVADLTMDALLKVIPDEQNPIDLNFASISSTEVHGTAFTSRYGVGGEYFLTNHVSMGFHANYIFGQINTFRISRFFPSGFTELPPIPPETTNSLPDNVLPTTHQDPVVGEQLQTAIVTEPREAVEIVQNPTDVTLNLRGVEASFMMRVYY